MALNAESRNELGKKYSKQLKREGKIPAVIYDNATATHISLDYKEAKNAIFTADTYIVNITLNGEVQSVIVRDTDFHPVKDTIEHIEFLRVHHDKPVELVLPIKFEGTPVGVTKGGRLRVKMRKLKVKGIPSKLPESVTINISKMELGGTTKVKDGSYKDLEVITTGSAAVASVEIPRSLRSAEAAKKTGK